METGLVTSESLFIDISLPRRLNKILSIIKKTPQKHPKNSFYKKKGEKKILEYEGKFFFSNDDIFSHVAADWQDREKNHK